MFKDKPKIDNKMRTKITNDWLKEFPEYKKHPSGRIDKVVGCIVISISYELSRLYDHYEIKSAICNLLNAPKWIYAALSYRPKSRRSSLTWEQHEKGLYLEAVQELKNDGPLPLEGPLTLSKLLAAYDKYKEEPGFSMHKLEDPSLILAWAGKIQHAKQVAEKNFYDWYKLVDDYEKESGKKSLHKPLDSLKEFLPRLESQQALQKQLEEQIVRFKLDKIPRYDLIIDVD